MPSWNKLLMGVKEFTDLKFQNRVNYLKHIHKILLFNCKNKCVCP